MKKIIIVLIILICIVSIAIFIKLNNTQSTQNTIPTNAVVKEEIKEPVEWRGNYIWDSSAEDNTWMCFRKKIEISSIPDKAITQIAVDSKYWLYINDEIVIREGAVKRGETPNSIYYDELDIAPYLRTGENTISMLVWYWGDVSSSHNSSGQGAMLFQSKIGDINLISDDTWKVSKNKAYLQDKLRPNNRLIEYNIYYDASLAEDDWYKTEFNDTKWKNAKVLGMAFAEPWGQMVERSIPQFKNYDLKEYDNISEYKNYSVVDKTKTIEMKIPYNAQFTPYLKINSKKGQKITIKTDQYEDVNGDSVRCTYITKDGVQEFESPAWMNGEKVFYEIPKGVEIISLGYRETGYDTEMTGKFESNDEFFNKLWNMADRTLYVNMRDSYMDCPNRERAQWFGDMSISMLEAMYGMDTNAYKLYEKGIKTTIGWKDGDTLLTVSPNTLTPAHLPAQMLAGINSMYEYYEYTGKKEFIESVYPSVKNYLNLWQVNENGLVDFKANSPVWEWGDSVASCDYKAIENAWYYLAMNKASKMAMLLGYQEDVNDYNNRLRNLKIYYNMKLWTEDGYKSQDSQIVDERANAIAVISGLADSNKYDTISNVLINSYDSTVYMEKYILEALCKMGKINEAQKRIKLRYGEMVEGENACSTLWENWKYDVGTKNHAWAGGPLIIMSKYFAGIEPLEKGYDIISIKPQFGELNKIYSKVTTVKGDIELNCEKSNNKLSMKIKVPSKTKIAIERINENPEIVINGKTVYKKGKKKRNKIAEYNTQDEKYIYFYLNSGEYEIECK